MQTSAPKLRLAQSGPGHIHITIMDDLQYSSTLADLLEHQPTRLLLLLFYGHYTGQSVAFSALTLLVGHHEEHLACKIFE